MSTKVYFARIKYLAEFSKEIQKEVIDLLVRDIVTKAVMNLKDTSDNPNSNRLSYEVAHKAVMIWEDINPHIEVTRDKLPQSAYIQKLSVASLRLYRTYFSINFVSGAEEDFPYLSQLEYLEEDMPNSLIADRRHENIKILLYDLDHESKQFFDHLLYRFTYSQSGYSLRADIYEFAKKIAEQEW